MSEREPLFRISPAFYMAVERTPTISQQDKKAINGWAALANIHNNLRDLPRDEAVKKFDKLEPDIQAALRQYYIGEGDSYLPEENKGIFTRAKEAITGVLGRGIESVDAYAQLSSSPGRMLQAELTGGNFDFGKYADYRDGERMFDKNLEKRVDDFYGPAVAKIAKGISTKQSFSEILATLETDAEWLAWEEYMEKQDDSKVSAAIKDYANAKYSYGRGLARRMGFDVAPGERGIEQKAYKFVSGTADVGAMIFLDPTLIFGKAANAIRAMRRGTMVLARIGAEQGQEALAKKIDDMFDTNKVSGRQVTAFWDRTGELIKKSGEGSKAERGYWTSELRRYAPEMAPHVDTLRQAKVFDANSAKAFLNNVEMLENISVGKPGRTGLTLPTHSYFRQTKLTIRDAVRKAAGKDPEKTIAKMDTVVEALERGESAATAAEIRNIRSAGQRFGRMFERAAMGRYINVGPNRAQSRDQIYAVARSVLPRMESNIIADAFANAPDSGTARQIVRGLFDTVADAVGVTRTGAQKAEYERLVEPIFKPRYSERATIGEFEREYLKNRGMSDADILEYNPALRNGQEAAIALEQLSETMAIADYRKLFELANNNKANSVMRSLGGIHSNRALQTITDYWSAANLLPRLGIRAVLDENLFHYLSMPTWAAKELIAGRIATTTYRRLNETQKQVTGVRRLTKQGSDSMGIVSRAYNNAFNEIDVAAYRKLKKPEDQAKFIEEYLATRLFAKRLLGDQERKYMARYISNYGAKRLEAIGEGVSNAASADLMRGRMPTIAEDANINLNLREALKGLGREFGDEYRDIAKADDAFKVSFLAELNNRVDRNGKIGELAVTYMDQPQIAVREINKWLNGPDGAKWKKEFQNAHNADLVSEDFAFDLFMHVRKLFLNDAGTVNTALLNKVRRVEKGKTVIDARLTGADIDEVLDNLPSTIKGRSLTGGQTTNYHSFLDKMINEGFRWSDRQLATLSRQPVMSAYYLGYRKQFAKNEEAFIKRQQEALQAQLAKKEITQKQFDKAMSQVETLADTRYGNLASDAALTRMIGYIDNPAVRSNFAYGMRNFARYYRAQEDFYRRVMRVANIVENPEALVRLRLSMEAMDHSGNFYKDENGDTYFIFPADEIMYQALNIVTGNGVGKVMPMRLTGKIKMITPSLDPNAALPTLSSPISAVLIKGVSSLWFLPPEYRDDIERVALGEYAEGQRLSYQLLPSAARKAIEIGRAIGPYENSEQVMSAAMKAAAFRTMTDPNAPGSASSAAERKQFEEAVWQDARNIVFLRNVLGIFAPVSPQLSQIQNMDKEMLKGGVTSLKSVYNDLVTQEIKRGSERPYDTAYWKFAKAFPGAAVYTVSETEMDQVASVRATKQVADYIVRNPEMFKEHPQGAAFLVPNVGEFDMKAYSFLKNEGFLKRKEMDKFFSEIANIEEENIYYDMRKKAEENIAAAPFPQAASARRQEWEKQREQYMADRPYLRLKFEQREGTQYKEDALDDLRMLVNSEKYANMDGVKEIRDVIYEFDSVRYSLGKLDYSSAGDFFRQRIKGEMTDKLYRAAAGNPAAENVIETLLKRLVEF